MENDIEASLRRGEKLYYKPLVIKAYSAYEDPMSIQGIKASMVWNRLRDPEIEAIDLTARNTIDVVKVIMNPSNIGIIKDKYPEVYERMVDLFMDDKFFTSGKKEISTIAVPVDVNVPEWVIEFIDYKTIINNNISNFPYKSCNIRRLGANNINYSTIMKL